MNDELKMAKAKLAEAEKGGDPEEIAREQSVVAMLENAAPKGKGKDEAKADLDPHDLRAIPGIGAATDTMLREHGITTLKQLARVSASRAEELGIKEDWIEEAKRLTS